MRVCMYVCTYIYIYICIYIYINDYYKVSHDPFEEFAALHKERMNLEECLGWSVAEPSRLHYMFMDSCISLFRTKNSSAIS